MVAVRRSRLPSGAQKVEAGLWVSKGRAYKKVNAHYICEGVYKTPPSRRAFRKGKLNEGSAAFIKAQLAAGASQNWLALRFSVTAVTIHNIGRNRIWKTVEAPVMELEGPPKGVHFDFWDEHLPEEEVAELEIKKAKLDAKKAAK